jgi:Domain of unknown function (DUF4189)
MGMTRGEATRRAAVARARASCGDLSTCPTEGQLFGTECGVFAYSASGWAITAGDDIWEARETAVSECRKRAKSCEIGASVCADGAERYSAAK